MRHKWLVLVVLVVLVAPAAADHCLCNFAAGGPTAVNGSTDPREYQEVTGPEVNKLKQVEQQVRRSPYFSNFPGQFRVIAMPGRNAFMFPSGEGYFTQEMVAHYGSDELAGVMGHEMLHFYKQHGKRQAQKTNTWLTLAEIAVLTTGGNLERNLVYGLLGGLFLDRGRTSRGMEYDADSGGVVIGTLAGYNPLGLAWLMDDFARTYPASKNVFIQAVGAITYPLSSHPPSGKRANKIRELASDPQVAQLKNARTEVAGNQALAQRRDISLYVEQINLEGYGYSSPGHVHQLMLTELRKHVRVFERQTPEVRYKAVLSANIAIGWSGGSRGVFLPDFGIQVSSGRSRAHGEFAGTVVDLQGGEVVAGVTTPRHGTSKTNTGLFIQAGRLSPIAIQSQSAGSMEQILLQRLVREGIGAWVAALVKTVEPAPVAASQPPGLATSGVDQEPDYYSTLDPGGYAIAGETWGVYEGAERVGTVRVVRVEGRTVYFRLLSGRGPGPNSKCYPDG